MENLDASEVTLLVALVGAWSMALIMIAGVVIRDIVRAWRGTDAEHELTMEWQPTVSQERWDLATGGTEKEPRPLPEPGEGQSATGRTGASH